MVALATEFAELASDVRGEGDSAAALQRVVQLAVQNVEGCRWASITDVAGGKGRSLASSDPTAAAIDAIQHRLGEGPCVQAAFDDNNYLMFDVEREPRWPQFAARAAAETPLRCVLAIRLPGGESAALNYYADHIGAYTDEAVAAASILAAHASGLVAIGHSEAQAQNLEAALESNRKIGMAMGVLMAHHKVTEADAFTLLRNASQRLHRKLRDVAAEVTETGLLPDLPVSVPSASLNGHKSNAAPNLAMVEDAAS